MPKRSRKHRSKKQKLYNMKGCSKRLTKNASKSRKQRGGYGCGAYGCPLAPFSWKQMQHRGGKSLRGGKYTNVMQGAPILGTAQHGGTCDSCNASPTLMKGGSFYKAAAPMPGPFVGQAWSSSVSTWPGVDGVSNNRNYVANNLYNAGDPQTIMKLGGSNSKRMNKRMNKSGGGIIPQDLVNLGSDVSFNFKSAYNALNGYSAPTSPLPYKDQLSSSISANRIII